MIGIKWRVGNQKLSTVNADHLRLSIYFDNDMLSVEFLQSHLWDKRAELDRPFGYYPGCIP